MACKTRRGKRGGKYQMVRKRGGGTHKVYLTTRHKRRIGAR